MKLNPFLRRSLCLMATCALSSHSFASTIENSEDRDLDQKDINAVREWINTKRQVTVRELGGALSLSGEVRTEFQSTAEILDGIKQRGHGGAVLKDHHPLPTNTFDIQVNIMLDYRTENSWCAIKLEFDNDAGIFSGTLNKMKVARAYWGARVIQGKTYTFIVELGRRKMSTIVDSKLEFSNFFDGAWFRYEQSLDAIGDLYAHAGVFIINENKNQFGYLGELGILNIADTGFYTKYSLIDWDTKDQHNKVDNQRFDFIVSQVILGYKYLPKKLKKVVQIYLAGLWNHEARKLPISNYKRANWGGYLGFSIGELRKKGDWAFDINYQVLAAQCIPDFDVNGIGFGNAADTGFYTSNIRGGGTFNTRKDAGGNVNYRGFQMTLDYLLTNQLNIQQSWQQSITLDDSIGPFHRYKQYEIEFIYGF